MSGRFFGEMRRSPVEELFPRIFANEMAYPQRNAKIKR
jgi:hypothetical protein